MLCVHSCIQQQLCACLLCRLDSMDACHSICKCLYRSHIPESRLHMDASIDSSNDRLIQCTRQSASVSRGNSGHESRGYQLQGACGSMLGAQRYCMTIPTYMCLQKKNVRCKLNLKIEGKGSCQGFLPNNNLATQAFSQLGVQLSEASVAL